MQSREYPYMVKKKVWEAAGMPIVSRHQAHIAQILFRAKVISRDNTERHLDTGGKLCVRCIENRLGRTLCRKDFRMDLPICNDKDWPRSELLTYRLRSSNSLPL